jgi:TolB-like protein/class 3 adenylate cyclase/lipoprotein NlpI
MTETRKLAAILVADIVGYSRLMSEDEAGTAKMVRGRREAATPIVRSFNGRLVKTMGDGVLLEFPSVVAAVECAIAIQKMMAERNATLPEGKRILYRVGVNLGDILIEGDDILGDGVNVAARLEGICEPGGVCLSAAAYDQVRGRIETEFVELGEHNLKNIAQPVRVHALTPAVIAAAKSADPAPIPEVRRDWKRLSAVASAVVVVLLALASFAWRAGVSNHLLGGAVAEDNLENAPRLSIVVLPFENLSGDKEQDYFADGITDDLTTDLSHIDGSFVIARNTAFTYKGKPIDVREIGRELGVRYALEGSVRRTGDNVVVNAKLVSTDTGAHVWADRFEGERSKIGDLQLQAVARIANALGVQLINAEALRAQRERPNNPDAVDLAMQGWALINQPDSKERFEKAIPLFERSLELDPQNVRAMAGLALTLCWRASDGWSGDRSGDVARAESIVTKALRLQPDNAALHNAYAAVLSNRDQWQAAITENETAIAYDRNNSKAYGDNGLNKMFTGQSEAGIADLEYALRLSPRDSGIPIYQYYICLLNNALARWEQAIEWCTRSVASDPDLTDPLIQLAVANSLAGHDKEAHEVVAKIQKALPGYTLQKLPAMDQWTENPTFKAQWVRIVEGLRKAGLPEETDSARVHLSVANQLSASHKFDDALSEVNAAIEIDPNLAEAYATRGLTYILAGRAKEAIPELEAAFRLSPSDPLRNQWEFLICHAHTHMAEWEKSIEWCQKSIATNGSNWFPYVDLAAANGWLGSNEEARKAVEGLLNLKHGFTVRQWASEDFSDNPTFLREFQGIVEGLRKAGLPEE